MDRVASNPAAGIIASLDTGNTHCHGQDVTALGDLEAKRPEWHPPCAALAVVEVASATAST